MKDTPVFFSSKLFILVFHLIHRCGCGRSFRSDCLVVVGVLCHSAVAVDVVAVVAVAVVVHHDDDDDDDDDHHHHHHAKQRLGLTSEIGTSIFRLAAQVGEDPTKWQTAA